MNARRKVNQLCLIDRRHGIGTGEMIRRLIHRLGFHWWEAWHVYNSGEVYAGLMVYKTVEFQRRTCRLCPAEHKRVKRVIEA